MDRLSSVRRYAEKILSGIAPNGYERAETAAGHTYGVAELCARLARSRGLNAELALACGLLHDLYSYKSDYRPLHGINGAEMIRVAFKRGNIQGFSEEEQIIIRSAVFHHSDKSHIHDEYDEVLKDADALERRPDLGTGEVPHTKRPAIKGAETVRAPEPGAQRKRFSRAAFADVAERLAQKPVTGVRNDPDYMQMIRYYPEDSAFDELKNGWCAAFVFHCALEAGLILPLRHAPAADTRFACVAAWLEWGEKNGFCAEEAAGFEPQRGDIVIYDRIIPPRCKPTDTPWFDHIGILLAVKEDALAVAEGNGGNGNISGVFERRKGKNIGCFIRIPESYEYDGAKYDYKTGKPRGEPYL